ncbi:MAG: Na+/H+ antiporter [Propionibacteriaceae bacterium]|jgi:CPA1 family monovalent cation:H+ antiporter|nr:Na+/H+ antiporter [Propionibacteriaceae bacterium]
METALFVVALVTGILLVTAGANRFGFPPPLALVVVGVLVGYLPGVPEVHLEPELVLLGLLPPLLYAEAVQTSLADFRLNRRTILLLSIGLVVFTAAGVAVVAHALLPDLGWPAAFAIGAVVAPPDAVATTAVARRIGMPDRLVTILEGESLLNDATALVALRTAIAAIGATVTVWQVAGDFLLSAGGGAAVGFAVYLVVAWFRPRIKDPVLDTAVSFLVPFVAYLGAEAIHASGVLAVVIAGLLLGHRAPVLQTAKSRVTERTNWRTIAFLLQNAVFLLIGLQARWIVGDVLASAVPLGQVIGVCLATLGAVIVLRLVWVVPARYLLIRPGPDPLTGQRPPLANTFLLGWAGMRGVVTLAAAFVIPTTVAHREVLLLMAFTVVAGTLLVQGLSLPWLRRVLKVTPPDPAEHALARATLLEQATRAAEDRLAELEFDDPHDVVSLIRQRSDQRNFAAWERLGTNADLTSPSELYALVRTELLAAERARVLQVRSTGQVPSDVVAEVLAMLDLEESMIDEAETATAPAGGTTRHATGEGCLELDRYPAVDAEPATVCPECVAEGLTWVSLRRCLECGHVGCCDSSPARHATAHFRATGHPVIQSAQPGENWRWCYLHQTTG